MNEKTENSLKKPVWKNRWFLISSTTAILLTLALISLPYFISSQLKSWLIENGADTVSIEDININPFTGTAAVKNLDIQANGASVLSSSLVELDLSLLTLLKKGVVIQSATLNQLKIDVEQTNKGIIRIGSYSIDPAKKTDDEIAKDLEKEIAWWLKLGNVSLKDCVVRYNSPDFNGNFFIEKAEIENFTTQSGAESAELKLKGKFNKSDVLAEIKLQQLSPLLRLTGDISLSKLNLNDFSSLTSNTLQTLNGNANASGKFALEVLNDSGLKVDYTGKANISEGIVNDEVFSFTAKDLEWDGQLSFKQTGNSNKSDLKLAGKLIGTELATTTTEIVNATSSKLNWQGEITYANKKGKSPAEQNVSMDGQLDTAGLFVDLLSAQLSIRHEQLKLSPKLSLQIAENKIDLSGTGKILATTTRVDDTGRKLMLISVSSLTIPGVNIESLEKIKLTSIKAEKIGLIQNQINTSPGLNIGDAELDELNYLGNGVVMQKISIGKFTGDLARDKNGMLNLLEEFQNTPAESTPAQKSATISDNTKNAQVTDTDNKTVEKIDANTDVASSPEAATNASTRTEKNIVANTVTTNNSADFEIKIAEINFRDDSVITFTDNTVTPAFSSKLDINSLHIADIDTTNPKKSIPVKLVAKLNNYANLTIAGSVIPYLANPSVDLKIKLNNQNMVALSPYVISSTGYQVRSGQLNIDSTLLIKDGNIDAKNAIFLKKLRLDEKNIDEISKHAGSIGMPLDKAMSMLRDKNDNIKLDIPIKGKLGEVEIGTGQILNTVLKKATTAGMKTYLLYAFQPYGALIMAGQLAGKLAGKIYLDPVFYQAGVSDLTNEQKDYLKKLGKVMQDRPKIDVQICAHTNSADLSIKPGQTKAAEGSALTKKQHSKSKKLGLARQKAIKDYLINEFKVKDGRLILCSPEFDKKPDAKPRIELLI